MKIKTNNNFNKISTKEELTTLLKNYNGILNDAIINYLKSLIELEFSVIRNYISDDEKAVLSELKIYKKVAIYNIYHKALNLFKQSGLELQISGNNEEFEGLIIYAPIKEKIIKLFEFDYTKDSDKYIGDISLFQTIEDAELREKELMRILDILDKLYDEKNPYHSEPYIYGGPFSKWLFEHSKKIEMYEEKFKQLDGKIITDEEKREIEITKQFHELLLEDYGLTNKSFENCNNTSVNFDERQNELYKILVKKMPSLSITDNIKYI